MDDTKTLRLSFEFFPPKTQEGSKNLEDCASALAELSPEFFSVTFGAGGSTQKKTAETVLDLAKNTGIKTSPHISCIASNEDAIKSLINLYQSNGIKRLLALRGDLPLGMDNLNGKFSYAADLVKFIRQETGDFFHIIVACYPEYHPQTKHADHGLRYFKRKVEMGANCAITQYFYNPDAYFRFLDACEKWQIQIPIIPGIMPITNYHQLARFSDRCGAELPRWMRIQLESYGDDLESIQKFGEDVVSELCQKLLNQGAPGLHFYTLNKARASMAILSNLYTRVNV